MQMGHSNDRDRMRFNTVNQSIRKSPYKTPMQGAAQNWLAFWPGCNSMNSLINGYKELGAETRHLIFVPLKGVFQLLGGGRKKSYVHRALNFFITSAYGTVFIFPAL